jgi:hypothetical protein
MDSVKITQEACDIVNSAKLKTIFAVEHLYACGGSSVSSQYFKSF